MPRVVGTRGPQMKRFPALLQRPAVAFLSSPGLPLRPGRSPEQALREATASIDAAPDFVPKQDRDTVRRLVTRLYNGDVCVPLRTQIQSLPIHAAQSSCRALVDSVALLPNFWTPHVAFEDASEATLHRIALQFHAATLYRLGSKYGMESLFKTALASLKKDEEPKALRGFEASIINALGPGELPTRFMVSRPLDAESPSEARIKERVYEEFKIATKIQNKKVTERWTPIEKDVMRKLLEIRAAVQAKWPLAPEALPKNRLDKTSLI